MKQKNNAMKVITKEEQNILKGLNQFKNRDICELLDISHATALRLINYFINLGQVKVIERKPRYGFTYQVIKAWIKLAGLFFKPHESFFTKNAHRHLYLFISFQKPSTIMKTKKEVRYYGL